MDFCFWVFWFAQLGWVLEGTYPCGVDLRVFGLALLYAYDEVFRGCWEFFLVGGEFFIFLLV